MDMVTPMLTQLTYEGLIDEMIGIKNCMFHCCSRLRSYSLLSVTAHVEVPASLLSAPTAQGSSAPTTSTPTAAVLTKEAKKKYHLNASIDPVFNELKDLNFSEVGKVLNRTARRLDEDYKVWLTKFYYQS